MKFVGHVEIIAKGTGGWVVYGLDTSGSWLMGRNYWVRHILGTGFALPESHP
jgi:hypothetical protein